MISLRGSYFAARAALAAAALAGWLGGSARADDAPSASSAPQPGTWQSHKYSFQFMGFTSTYSCDGLADKLRKLLLAAGARADLKSQPGACASGFGHPDKFARADLTFATLAPVDSAGATVPAAAGAGTTATAGGTAAGTAAPGKPVPGVWRPVAFARDSPRELATGDCELIEQFRTQVLPMFSTRNVSNDTTCVPYQDSGSTIDLKFESFSALPGQKQSTKGG